MTGSGAPPTKAAYVTMNSRMEEIRELWGREPTANELRALAELPLDNKACLDDDSENGRKAYRLLRSSEQNRDVSLLEEAGRLLWEQSMRLPPHWQSHTPRPLPLNDLPDNAYQFSPMSNDPFAKVGSVRTVQSKTSIRNISVTKSLESNRIVPKEIRLKEPENTPYPDVLINPPERWIRKSPHSAQPMRLIPHLACTNSYSMVQQVQQVQQAQRQIAAPRISSGQKNYSVSKKANPVKASDPYRLRKPTEESKSRPKSSKNKPSSVQGVGGFQGLQGAPQPPALLINPTVPPSNGQQAYFAVPSATAISSKAGQNTYTTKLNQHPRVSPSGAMDPVTNLAPNPYLASQRQFPASTASGMTPSVGPIQNQHTYSPATYQLPLPLPPIIRTPIMPIALNQQAELDMPWLQLTPGNYMSITAAADAMGTQPYSEVYRIAKETADNLAKMLAEQ